MHPLRLVIVALITFALGSDYFPSEAPGLSEAGAYLLGLASALALLAGILLHELGHALVARRHGLEIEEIDLWLLGGVARMTGEPRAPEDELRFAAAGPAVTCAVVAVFGARCACWPAASSRTRRARSSTTRSTSTRRSWNSQLAARLPAGRRADRRLAALAALGRSRAGHRRGRARRPDVRHRPRGHWARLVRGGSVGGLWLALIGGFLVVAAGAEAQRAEIERELGGQTAASIISAPAVALCARPDARRGGRGRLLPPPLQLVFGCCSRRTRTRHILAIDDVRRVPAAERSRRLVGSVATLDRSLLVPPDTPVAQLLTRSSFLRTGRAVVVDADDRPLGIVSITDIQRRLRADALLPDKTARRAA